MNKKGTFCGVLAILLFFMMVSCKVELGIPEKKMAAILTDFYMANGVVITQQISRSPDFLDSAQIYTPILKKHGYTIDEFKSSMDLYMKNPRILENVYSDVLQQLTKLQNQFSHVAAADLKKARHIQEELSTYIYYEISIAGDTLRAYW